MVGVGMFDYYRPQPGVACPWCGENLMWQGKDGPNLLFVWEQGERHPVEHDIDEEIRFTTDRLQEFVLPETFDIRGWCTNGHGIRASCRCSGGIWSEIDTSEAERQAAEDAERERIKRLRASWRADRP
jgi:hypothetical protein